MLTKTGAPFYDLVNTFKTRPQSVALRQLGSYQLDSFMSHQVF